MYFCDSDYLVPDKPGRTAFTVFREALLKTKKIAIARAVIRNREYLYAIKSHKNVLVAYTLYALDIREVDQVADVDELQGPVDSKMVEVAEAIITQMEKPFVPTDYVDEYTESLRKTIGARIHGKEVVGAPATAGTQNIVSLMDVLKKSLKQAREKKKFSEAVKEEKPARKSRGQDLSRKAAKLAPGYLDFELIQKRAQVPR